MYVTTTGVGIGTSAASVTSQLFVTSRASGRVGAIIRGAASQTARLQEWQTSAGTVLGAVEANGQTFFASGNCTITSAGNVFSSAFRTSNDWFQGSQANSGGRITMTRQTAADSNPGANNARLYFRDGTNAGTLKLVVRAGASGAETTILDNIPQ
jgi:hypothetical protein